MRKTITVREFLNNVRKNGLRKNTGTLFVNDEGYGLATYPRQWKMSTKIASACAMGQGLINSGVLHGSTEYGDVYGKVYSTIYTLNDDHPSWNMNKIAEEAIKYLGDRGLLDRTMTLERFDYTPYLDDSYQPKEI